MTKSVKRTHRHGVAQSFIEGFTAGRLFVSRRR